MRTTSAVRLAIVHEWLTNRAGSEKCVEALTAAFPASVVHAALHHPEAFPGWSPAVRTSFVDRVPLVRRSQLTAMPLLPLAMRFLRVDPDAEVVFRSFHTFSTMPRDPAGRPEVVYCYTPPRFLYRSATMASEGPVVRGGMAVLRRLAGPGDRRRFDRADVVLADSTFAARLVGEVYGREATVVFPPVAVDRFRAASSLPKGEDFLWFGRLVPYKRPDLAIEAFRLLPDQRLVVAGGGRLLDELRAGAPPNVSFLGHVPDAELPALMARSRALVFPGVEDFGIVPVECMAAGTPVIAFAAGGALDTVVPGASGVLVDDQSPAAVAAAVRAFAADADADPWDPVAVSATTDRFAEDRYRAEMVSIVEPLAGRR